MRQTNSIIDSQDFIYLDSKLMIEDDDTLDSTIKEITSCKIRLVCQN